MAAAILATGCTGGEDEGRNEPREADPNATLTSGIYDISHFDSYNDGCDLDLNVNGNTSVVTVSANDVVLDGISLAFEQGLVSGAETESDANLLNGVCFGDITRGVEGTVPANDEMDVVATLTAANPTGDCDDLPVELPCSTEYFARLTKQ